ncbi:hypothetical protein [Acidithrix ferrooxidans]|uniref:Uncharacterized protein n=1 Tax=Acidithrix ferrooxidans TaxID=1280514 RepID=A0A0D8HHV6_9ACTN|nr:hypothetical protein [Acidithrix ferrooxidans]KJF16666.1 hypothetical protein AXFE_25290 [Acidithrix ferrooxidans]
MMDCFTLHAELLSGGWALVVIIVQIILRIGSKCLPAQPVRESFARDVFGLTAGVTAMGRLGTPWDALATTGNESS